MGKLDRLTVWSTLIGSHSHRERFRRSTVWRPSPTVWSTARLFETVADGCDANRLTDRGNPYIYCSLSLSILRDGHRRLAERSVAGQAQHSK